MALPPPSDLPEFLFGPLSTEEGRLPQARLDRSGLIHPVNRLVLAPEAREAVAIQARVGPDLAVAAMELRYCTDAPGARGGVVPMVRTALEWDTLAWGCLEEWSASIPGQPAGTAVSYTLHATSVTGATLPCPWPASNSPRTYAYVVGRRPIPPWIREAVIDQVFWAGGALALRPG